MRRREFYEGQKLKKLAYVFSITLVVSIVLFLTVFVMYNKKLKQESAENLLGLKKEDDIVPNNDITETSFSSDSDIASASNNIISQNNVVSEENVVNTARNTTVVDKEPVQAVIENTVNKNTVETEEDENEEIEEIEKELIFMAPVSGEIIKDFATDTLVYSNTLEEWTTHTGIDIKADKTSIVVSAEAGVVESIKNDPRYGLTVTVTHTNGFKTIYSNLLTTEFVTEGEVVEKGQTLGTVGETASFEVADESHLHFEMYKDGVVVNPTIYLK